MAQAMVRFLDNQYVELDGVTTKFVNGIFGVFGHGCVVGVGQALQQGGHNLRFYQGKNEQNMALAAIRSTVIDFTVDDAITVGKSQIQTQVKQKLQEALAEDNIGFQIVNITVQDAEPPTSEIVSAFKANKK